MARTLSVIGCTSVIGRVRKSKCLFWDCTNKTRMALIVPCLDIEDEGGPGLAAIKVCSEHMEQFIVTLSKDLP